MANLSRHPSLRFSVFEVAADLGLQHQVLDGNFNPIIEEEEAESPVARHPQRQTHSSDELTDSPYPLTPPSSNDALYSTRPLQLSPKKNQERPRFIENFPPRSATPPVNIMSPPNRPSTPRTGSGKLRKVQTPVATSPPLELRLDFGTDVERDLLNKRPSRERERKVSPREASSREKKTKDISSRSHQASPITTTTPDDEEKGILGGLLRFRTKSKERKAAAKQALQQENMNANAIAAGEYGRSMTPPNRMQTPPPLPIAERFARSKEEVAFRPPLPVGESGSSHGHGTNSVGHEKSVSDGGSTDVHYAYPRARDRSSRYERPHPVWRSGPTVTGRVGTVLPGEGNKTLPQAVHVRPPNQTIFDREPVRQMRVQSPDNAPKVDMEAVNKYYGITPATASPASPALTPSPLPAVVNVPATPSPQSRFALAQALAPTEPSKGLEPSTPRLMTPSPASPSPYIVPSPSADQVGFGAQKREKRGRMNIPPALDPSQLLPVARRKMGSMSNPPPTPPPTTELPPLPTDMVSPTSSLRPPPMPSPLSASAGVSRSPSPGMLRMGMSSSLGSLVPPPPPYSERPGTITPENNMGRSTSPLPPSPSPLLMARSASPIQRGKTPAFPARPVTPTRPITPSRRPTSPPEVQQRSPIQQQQRSPVEQRSNYLLNRRPSTDRHEISRPRRSSLNENDLKQYQQISRVQPSSQPIPRTKPLNSNNSGSVRKSFRRSQFQQNGYDSDDGESRYSRDTYYGRETAYFDDQNMPPLPGMGGDAPPLPVPQRDLGDVEMERKAGRERLLRFLSQRDT